MHDMTVRTAVSRWSTLAFLAATGLCGLARGIRDRCMRDGVPFFFKQWGGTQCQRAGRTLDGRTRDELPPGVPRSL